VLGDPGASAAAAAPASGDLGGDGGGEPTGRLTIASGGGSTGGGAALAPRGVPASGAGAPRQPAGERHLPDSQSKLLGRWRQCAPTLPHALHKTRASVAAAAASAGRADGSATHKAAVKPSGGGGSDADPTWQALWAALQSVGWRAERFVDGEMLYFVPSSSSSAAASSSSLARGGATLPPENKRVFFDSKQAVFDYLARRSV
jgi:hypothetical protein